MAQFYIAQDTGWDYYFEVCDDQAGQCSHSQGQHRTYTWSKEPNAMPIASMVTEIKLLEAARLAALATPPANPVRLTTRSLPLEGQEL